MSNQRGWRHPGLFIAFGVLALLFIVGASFLLFGLFVARPFPGPGFPYFPFGIFWAFLLVFFVFGIVRWAFWGWGWGWRRRGYYGRYYWRYDQAHQILRERYARGEITKDQVDQMTRDLDQQNQPATRPPGS
jgi:uncharacterized membrane protein